MLYTTTVINKITYDKISKMAYQKGMKTGLDNTEMFILFEMKSTSYSNVFIKTLNDFSTLQIQNIQE